MTKMKVCPVEPSDNVRYHIGKSFNLHPDDKVSVDFAYKAMTAGCQTVEVVDNSYSPKEILVDHDCNTRISSPRYIREDLVKKLISEMEILANALEDTGNEPRDEFFAAIREVEG